MGLVVPGHDPLVFDLGTGLRYCGDRIPATGPFTGTCLLTHMHWDHVQGLPFFVPTLRDGANFDIFGPVQEDGRTVREVFESIIKPPMFPVSVTASAGGCAGVAADSGRSSATTRGKGSRCGFMVGPAGESGIGGARPSGGVRVAGGPLPAPQPSHDAPR